MKAGECYAIMRIWGYVEVKRGVSIVWRGRENQFCQTPVFENEPAEARAAYLERVMLIHGHEWPAAREYTDQAASGDPESPARLQ